MPETLLPKDANGRKFGIYGNYGRNEDLTLPNEHFNLGGLWRASVLSLPAQGFLLEPQVPYEIRMAGSFFGDAMRFMFAAVDAATITTTIGDYVESFRPIGIQPVWQFTAKAGQEQMGIFVSRDDGLFAGLPMLFSIRRLR